MVTNMLSEGHYVIAGVSLSTKTGFLTPNGIGTLWLLQGAIPNMCILTTRSTMTDRDTLGRIFTNLSNIGF